MDDPLNLFDFPEVRVRQPGKLLAGRARYEIFGDRKEPVAVATETEGRSVMDKITKLLPDTRQLQITTEAGEALFTLLVQGSEWVAGLTDSGGKAVGKIRIGASRRHYTLVNEADEVIGEAVGDLAVKRFTVKGVNRPPFAEIRKTWAGPVKEAFTSADHYSVKFSAIAVPPSLRTLTVMVPIVLDLAKYGPA